MLAAKSAVEVLIDQIFIEPRLCDKPFSPMEVVVKKPFEVSLS
ncbi:hypothetical protein [Niallia oryzisoli]